MANLIPFLSTTAVANLPIDQPVTKVTLGGSFEQRISIGLPSLRKSWLVTAFFTHDSNYETMVNFFEKNSSSTVCKTHVVRKGKIQRVYWDYWRAQSLGNESWEFTVRLTEAN